MSPKLLIITLAIGSLCLATSASADDLEKPIFSVAGFGTLGLTHSTEDQADFTSSYLQPNGAGYTSSWSASVDSRFGLQVTGNFTPKFSGVVQLITQQRYNDSYVPTVEWANLKYQFTPDLSVRVGRIALPTFLASDYRTVGYAIPWLRTPGEVYDLIPITNSDGIDLRYRMHNGDFKDTVQASLGKTSIDAPAETQAVARAIRGITNTVEYGATTLRFSYLEGNLNLTQGQIQTLFDVYDLFGPAGMALSNKYTGLGKQISYLGLGFNYDPGNWFLMGEAGQTRSHSYLGQKTAAYLSAGYRMDKFTPYLILAEVNASGRSDPGLSTTGLPPSEVAEVGELNAALNILLGRIAVQKSVALGVRWDLLKNAALKVQFDAIQLGNGSPGDLGNVQPGFVSGGRVNVTSVVLDFVF
jgi:hypothetical protein